MTEVLVRFKAIFHLWARDLVFLEVPNRSCPMSLNVGEGQGLLAQASVQAIFPLRECNNIQTFIHVAECLKILLYRRRNDQDLPRNIHPYVML